MEFDITESFEIAKNRHKHISVEQTYAQFKDSGLTVLQLCNFIETLSLKDLTYEEYQHYYPMAEELSFALENHLITKTYE